MQRVYPILIWLTLSPTPFMVHAQTPTTAPSAEEPADEPPRAAHLDSEADQRVRAMSDFLARQKKFGFNVEITYDAVEPDGQKIQLGRRSRVEVRRPDGLRSESQGDRRWNQVFTFDGEWFLLNDRAHHMFSRTKAPATLDELFKFLFEKYGVSPPLVDFLLPDVHGAMTDSAESMALLGDAFVAEHECDHIAFSGEMLDWQLWIQKGDAPWPRKFVITYKDIDVRPQFMAVFREWQTDVPLTAARFDTSPPAGATEVPMERFVGDEAGDEASGEGADAPRTETEDPKEGESE